MTKNNYKKGVFTDDEKRTIEKMAATSTYAAIARHLNRNPASVRKYCQRNAITDDIPSIRRHVEFKARNNHHFNILKDQLTPTEFDFAIQVYKGMLEQFGNDILYSEEVQIVEYCMVTCLLNRAFSREKNLNEMVEEQRGMRLDLQKEKDKLLNTKTQDEDEEAEKYDQEQILIDRIEIIDMRLSELQTEHRDVKKDQISFLDRKEKITKALNISREQRAQELTKVNQNFGDLITSLKRNEQFRRQVGLEIERMRIGIREEYIRLSNLHLYADGEYDHPIFNTEVHKRQNEQQSGANRVIFIPDENENEGDDLEEVDNV